LIVPAIVTSPEASIVTGVLVVFGVKVTVTPTGIVMVVKLNLPLGGTAKAVLLVGEKAPSAPLLPLSKRAARAGTAVSSNAPIIIPPKKRYGRDQSFTTA